MQRTVDHVQTDWWLHQLYDNFVPSGVQASTGRECVVHYFVGCRLGDAVWISLTTVSSCMKIVYSEKGNVEQSDWWSATSLPKLRFNYRLFKRIWFIERSARPKHKKIDHGNLAGETTFIKGLETGFKSVLERILNNMFWLSCNSRLDIMFCNLFVCFWLDNWLTVGESESWLFFFARADCSLLTSNQTKMVVPEWRLRRDDD